MIPVRKNGFEEAAYPAERRLLPVILLLLTTCVLLYANSLRNEFVFDDAFTVVNDPTIRNFNLSRMFTTWYRPIRTFSLVLDYHIWGLNPVGFRLTNILIHGLNCVLVLILANRIVSDSRAAIFAAFLFAVHPIQTDSVAYISGRRDVLFALFYLISFYCYIRFRETRRRGFGIGSLSAFALSLMTKEMAATFPAVLLLWDIFARWETGSDRGRLPQFGQRLWEAIKENRWLIPAGLLMLAGFLALYTIQGRGLGSPRALRLEYWGGNFYSNLLTVLTIHTHYLKLVVWPQTLVASYQGAFPIAQSFWEPRVLLSFALLMAVAAVAILELRRDKVISFGLAFYFVTLLPVSQIIPHHELLAEHFLYLPMFGIALVAGQGLSRLAGLGAAWKRPVYAGFALAVLLLGARTVVRNRDWRDSFTLWKATYEAVPDSPRAAYNLGVEYLRRKEFDAGIDFLERAIELEPSHILAYNNLAAAYLAQGNSRLALETYKTALTLQSVDEDLIVWAKLDATYRMIRRNMAKCYLELGQPQLATDSVQRALAIGRGDAESYALLASIYARLNRPNAALDTCRQGLTRFPASEDLRNSLAGILAAQGQWEEALKSWAYLLEKNPDHAAANMSMALHAIDRDDPNSARQYLTRVTASTIDDAQLKELLVSAGAPYRGPRLFLLKAKVYEILGKPRQAIEACKVGMAQYPTDRDLRLTLAFLYVNGQNLEEAAAEWKRVIQEYPTDYLANLNLGTYFITRGDGREAQRYLSVAMASAPDEPGRDQVRKKLQEAERREQRPGRN